MSGSEVAGRGWRQLIEAAAAVVVAGMAVASAAHAQTEPADAYPSRLIKIIVPFPPGGPTDVAARIVVDQLGSRLKQTVIIENQAGASGRTGSKQVAKADRRAHV